MAVAAIQRSFVSRGVPFEEQQVRELLHVIAVAHPIVPKDVTVVPEF
jgi:hypothetical protein